MNLNVSEIVINTITQEFQAILNDDPETYKGYGVIITNEQQYIKKQDTNHKKIYIVVKFLQGNKDFGQQRVPFTLNAFGEHNSIKVCQQLMMDFAETNNLLFTVTNKDYTLRQTYTGVAVTNNFNEIFDGFRTLFYLSGTFFIGVNSNPITKIVVDNNEHSLDEFNPEYVDFTTTADYVSYYVYYEDEKTLVTADNKDSLGIVPGTTVAYVNDYHGEKIDFISSQLSYNAQVDSQPFFGTNNFNRSVAKIATLSIGFTMYSINTLFYNSTFDIIFNDNENVDINKNYKLLVSLKSGKTYTVNMKLVSVSNVQELRDFPASSFTFVR